MKSIIAIALIVCFLVAGSYSISCDKLCSRIQSLFPNKDIFTGCHSTCTTMFSADEMADDESEEMSSYAAGESLCVASGSNYRSSVCGNVVGSSDSNPSGKFVSQQTKACSFGTYSWVGLQLSNGQTVYVADRGQITRCGGSSGGSGKGKAAADFALQQVGKCYSQAQNLRKGPTCFDCSGLVNVAWARQGVRVPETTHGYPSSGIRKVSSSEIQPGDILYRVGHVGMYVGNGRVVQAANPSLGVINSSFSGFKYEAIYRPA